MDKYAFALGITNLTLGIIIMFMPQVTIFGQFVCAANIGSGINLMYQSGAWTVE